MLVKMLKQMSLTSVHGNIEGLRRDLAEFTVEGEALIEARFQSGGGGVRIEWCGAVRDATQREHGVRVPAQVRFISCHPEFGLGGLLGFCV